MAGGCVCSSGTCRPLLPLVVILASFPCVLRGSASPAAAAAKVYPRGNHWAVGHLMGKKSIELLPEQRDPDPDRDYLTPPETAEVTEMEPFQRLMEAVLQHRNQQHTANSLLHSGWREEDTDLIQMLLLALKLRDNDST